MGLLPIAAYLDNASNKSGCRARFSILEPFLIIDSSGLNVRLKNQKPKKQFESFGFGRAQTLGETAISPIP